MNELFVNSLAHTYSLTMVPLAKEVRITLLQNKLSQNKLSRDKLVNTSKFIEHRIDEYSVYIHENKTSGVFILFFSLVFFQLRLNCMQTDWMNVEIDVASKSFDDNNDEDFHIFTSQNEYSQELNWRPGWFVNATTTLITTTG